MLPASLGPRRFLDRYWQKRSLRLPAAADLGLPMLSGDELAWLAMQDDVEARLIVTRHRDDGTVYELRYGPFAERELASLPPQGWTLLVQDVEKHLPAFRDWFGLVDFIPDWRIDDLMISYAAPGGSVGPHRDNYDVFLVQAAGRREWRLAEAGAVRDAADSGPLSLLQPFDDPDPFDAGPGDALYLPPGIPHWGVALTECMTFSIGCRAPTDGDLRRMARLVVGDAEAMPASPGERFYTDHDLTPEEAGLPGRISSAALRRTRELVKAPRAMADDALARLLGLTVTETKEWLTPAVLPAATSRRLARDALAGSTDVAVHGMARLAYWQAGGKLLLFGNGHWRVLEGSAEAVVAALCGSRGLPGALVSAMAASAEMENLLSWLFRYGILDPACNG